MDKKPQKLPRLPNKVKGVSGQPKKDYTPEEIEKIKNSGSQYDASVVAKLVELGGDAERYLHVLRLKMRGLSRAEIAAALGFSISTIEKDITEINKRYEARYRTSTISYSLANPWLSMKRCAMPLWLLLLMVTIQQLSGWARSK